MRRVAFVLVAVVVAVATAGGVALAADQIQCPNRDGGRCIGTAEPDEMIGSRFDDTIRGRGGSDLIQGRRGSDELRGEVGGDEIVAARCAQTTDVYGGRGDDEITITSDCGNLTIVPPPDRVDCGPGYDVVRGAAPGDRIDPNCERVVPQRTS